MGRKRKPTGQWKGNLVFVLVLLPCIVGALRYDSKSADAVRAQARDRFTADADVRHTRLVTRTNSRRQILRSLASFFRASENVSESEFVTWAVLQLEQDDVSLGALCWTPTNGTTGFSSSTDSTVDAKALCNNFELLEPSRILTGQSPLLVLSEYTESRGGQRGFVSIVFEMHTLFLADESDTLTENLVVSDTLQNTAASYAYRGGDIIVEPITDVSEERRYFELARFDEVGFVYLATPRPLDSGAGGRIALLMALIGLSLMVSLYLRDQIVKRALITEEVRQRTDELSQFAYRTSHDLRSPLVTVAGLCRVVREDLDDGDLDEVIVNVSRIETRVAQLDRLVGDILELTRADLTTQAAEIIDLEQLVSDVVAQATEATSEPRVEIRTDVRLKREHHLPQARISQILENLVSNGIKYADLSRDAPFVEITLRDDTPLSDDLEIVVSDNGLGFPKAARERMFRMFERFHPKVGAIGSGLGMSIIKKHVDRLDGEIGVASEGHGTVVTVRLPSQKQRRKS